MPPPQQTIIIKKVVKGHGHHGGAWKVAYADFVTAMMAFFLLLWLLNSVTQEQLEGVSDYFAPTTASVSQSGAGDILGGQTITVDGAKIDTAATPTMVVDLPPPKAGLGGEQFNEPVEDTPDPNKTSDADAEAEAEAKAKAQEEEQLNEAAKQLQQALEALPEYQQLAESLLVENTPEGLRIQLVDQDGLAMFASGSSRLQEHTKKLLKIVSKVILTMPQEISISGHTDALKYRSGDEGYTNWELSADRANASRRQLLLEGVPESRISRVVGKAATEPLVVEDPNNARNRRLSIIMLRGTGQEDAAKKAAEESRRTSIITGK